MNLLNIIKLAKVLAKLEKVDSDQGPIIIDTLEPGAEIFIDGAEGEAIPAPDGTYLIEEGKRKVNVLSGKITSIEEVSENPDTVPTEEKAKEEKRKCEEMPKEAEEPKKEEPKEEVKTEEMPDEKDAKIAELEAAIAERDAKIAELEAEIEKIKSAPAQTELKKVKNVSPFKTYNHA